MIRLLCKIPNDSYLACSGGIDSMAILNFLLNAKKNISVVHINHGTTYGAEACAFMRREVIRLGVDSHFFTIDTQRIPSQSQEEYWRNERYRIFNSFDKPVITAHHLSDAIEWWVMSSLHGQSKLIPVQNKNVIRPFLTTSKSSIVEWAKNKKIRYMDDPSNLSREHMRNVVRHDIMPHILKVNPGIETVIRKMYSRLNKPVETFLPTMLSTDNFGALL